MGLHTTIFPQFISYWQWRYKCWIGRFCLWALSYENVIFPHTYQCPPFIPVFARVFGGARESFPVQPDQRRQYKSLKTGWSSVQFNEGPTIRISSGFRVTKPARNCSFFSWKRFVCRPFIMEPVDKCDLQATEKLLGLATPLQSLPGFEGTT